ncbi:MAG: Rieske (2Fe-2S) protein [Pirellulales bacterium]
MEESQLGPFRHLANLQDLAENSSKLVVVDDLWIGLFNSGGTIHAVDARCPHAGATLTKGMPVDGTIRCPVHAWNFRLSDGKYLDEDCADCDIAVYPVRIIDQKIEVQIPADTSDSRAE